MVCIAINFTKTYSDCASQKECDKMIYAGIKLLIVSAVCVITTVLTLSLLTSGYLGYMCGVDVVVNTICICLLTAYYPNHIYYERLCCCCLCCCPMKYRKKANLKNVINYSSSSLNPMTVGDDYIAM